MPQNTTVTVLGCWAHSAAGPTTSFHLQYGETGILVDCGVDPIGRMVAHGCDITGCNYLFISHCHSDHISGFCNFVFTRNSLGKKLEGFEPLTVVGNESTVSTAKSLLKLQYPDRDFRINWIVAQPETVLEIATDIDFDFLDTIHPVPCTCLRISLGDTEVGYTADSAPFSSQVDFFKNVDLLIGEAFGLKEHFGEKPNSKGHMLAEDLQSLVQATGTRSVIPFHFGEKYSSKAARSSLLNMCVAGKSGETSARILDPVENPIQTIVLQD